MHCVLLSTLMLVSEVLENSRHGLALPLIWIWNAAAIGNAVGQAEALSPFQIDTAHPPAHPSVLDALKFKNKRNETFACSV